MLQYACGGFLCDCLKGPGGVFVIPKKQLTAATYVESPDDKLFALRLSEGADTAYLVKSKYVLGWDVVKLEVGDRVSSKYGKFYGEVVALLTPQNSIYKQDRILVRRIDAKESDRMTYAYKPSELYRIEKQVPNVEEVVCRAPEGYIQLNLFLQ